MSQAFGFRASLSCVAIVLVAALVAPSASATAVLGKLTVQTGGGVLKITGTSGLENFIVTQQGLAAGEFRIEPDVFTTVNGVSTPLVVTGMNGDVRIDLKGGLDVLQVRDVDVGGDLDIDLGGGNDQLFFDDVDVTAFVRIGLGSGSNGIDIATTTCGMEFRVLGTNGGDGVFLSGPSAIGGRLFVDLKGGENSLSISTAIGPVTIGDELFYDGGAAGDSVFVDNDVHVDSNVKLLLAVGENSVVFQGDTDGSLLVVGGSDADSVIVGDTFNPSSIATIGGALELLLDAGGNIVTVLSCTVGADLFVNSPNGFKGQEEIFIGSTSVVGAIKIALGSGVNTAQIDNCPAVGSLEIKAKGGADQIDVTTCVIGGGATVKAGNGNNDVTFTGSSLGGSLSIVTGKDDDAIDSTGTTAGGVITIDPGLGTNTVVP